MRDSGSRETQLSDEKHMASNDLRVAQYGRFLEWGKSLTWSKCLYERGAIYAYTRVILGVSIDTLGLFASPVSLAKRTIQFD